MLFDEPLDLTSIHLATQRPARGFVGGLACLIDGAAQLRVRVRRDEIGVELPRGLVDALAFRAGGGELRARGGVCDFERLVDRRAQAPRKPGTLREWQREPPGTTTALQWRETQGFAYLQSKFAAPVFWVVSSVI